MKNADIKQKAFVQRTTIDEKLDDDLIRILVCSLKKRYDVFSDKQYYWNKEKEIYIQQKNYVEQMGISPSAKKKWPWRKFQEGQVFISGEFETYQKDRNGNIKNFKVSPNKINFLRVDEFFRDQIGSLYSKLLTRRIH